MRLPGLSYQYCQYSLINTLTASRDGGLPASPFFSKVHPKLKVPLNALYLTVFLVIIFGVIFLGSSRYAFLWPLILLGN